MMAKASPNHVEMEIRCTYISKKKKKKDYINGFYKRSRSNMYQVLLSKIVACLLVMLNVNYFF